MKNPLIQPILAIIEEHSQGISEYDLLRKLEKADSFIDLGEDPKLVLFRKHFIIMNALYQLQTKLWQEDQIKLSISPISISITTVQTNIENSDSTEIDDNVDAKLASYYLDWNEYDNMSAEDVELLLKGFYKKLHNDEDTKMALEILGVPANSSKSKIKQAYRQRVNHAHPDKGGDTKTFIKLRRAYEHLVGQAIA